MTPCCFWHCARLSAVLFEPASRLQEFCPGMIVSCPSLRSFCVPSSLRVLNTECFSDCKLSNLTFESPSHLDDLRLGVPSPFYGEQIHIPPSVTQLTIIISGKFTLVRPLVASFDRESRFVIFRCARDLPLYNLPTRGVFARFSERTLKMFRERRYRMRDLATNASARNFPSAWIPYLSAMVGNDDSDSSYSE
jgi:hypothetical protein